MKKFIVFSMIVGLLGLSALAEKITGEAMCTKCSMHETATCGTAIKTDNGDVYYCETNDVAKAFHKEICSEDKKVVAEGAVTEKDGKKWITLEKIEVAK